MINICMTWSINDGIGSFLNYHGDQSAGKYLHNHLLKACVLLEACALGVTEIVASLSSVSFFTFTNN